MPSDPGPVEALHEESFFRDLVEGAPDGVVVLSEGRIVYVNVRTEKLFGYTRDELLGQPVETLIPERLRGKHRDHRHAYLQDPRHRPMGAGLDVTGRRKDGTEFPIEMSLSPVETARGLFVSSAIRDITERKRAEEAVSRLAAIVTSSQDAIITTSTSGTITSWNRVAIQHGH
jgi:PAS domain S-box-containing protein